MFVKKFLERKPVRTAVKKWMKGDRKMTIETTFTEMDRLINDVMPNRVFYLSFDTNNLNPWVYECSQVTQYEEIPNDIINRGYYFKMEHETDDENLQSVNWFTMNSELSIIIGNVVDITQIREEGNIYRGVGNIHFLTEMKAVVGFEVLRLRALFRYLYYERAQANFPQTNTYDFQFFWLDNDIDWINSNLGVGNVVQFDWAQLGPTQFPGWYDNLTDDQKEYFPREMSYNGRISAYLQDVGEVLDHSVVNELIALKNADDPDFGKQYRLLLNKVRAELRCVCVDHKMQFWYRPYTEELECTSEHAFWCDPDAILVDYRLVSEDDSTAPSTAPVETFLSYIEEGVIREELASLTLRCLKLDCAMLTMQVTEETTTMDWLSKLNDFAYAIKDYVDDIYKSNKNILNLTSEGLEQLYSTIWTNNTNTTGIMAWIRKSLAKRYDNPWQDTNGLLIANGILSPRWQIISDCFNAIVTVDNTSQTIYYPNVDFETLLKSEHAEDDIAWAVWKPWYALFCAIIGSQNNITSIIELQKNTNYYIFHDWATFIGKDDEVNEYTFIYTRSEDDPESYWWEYNDPNDGQQNHREIEGRLQELYIKFYTKMPFFDAHELKCIFYDLTLWSASNISWYVIGAFGDFQLWSTFLDFDAYVDAMQVVTDGTGRKTTAPVMEIRKNYELPQINSDSRYPSRKDYECIDPYENISHLEAYYETQTDNQDLQQFKAKNCFVRTFGTRSSHYGATEKMYDFDSRFTVNLLNTSYDDLNLNLPDHIFAVINKCYSTYPVPKFEDWDWYKIRDETISYITISKENLINTSTYSNEIYTYQLGTVNLQGTTPLNIFIVELELPLYHIEKKLIAYDGPGIDFNVDNFATIQEKYKTWIIACNSQEKILSKEIHDQLALFIKYKDIKTGDEEDVDAPTITCYSVDSYLASDIDIMLNNIFATATEQMGVYAYDNAVFNYIEQNRTKLEEAFGGQIPSYGRFAYNRSGMDITRTYDRGSALEAKISPIRTEVLNEETNEIEVHYYDGVEGKFGNAVDRYKRWGEFTIPDTEHNPPQTIYGGDMCGEYEQFYEYTAQLEVHDPEPQPSGVQISAEMLDESEYEIYECDQIYETFILYETSAEKALNVTPTSGKANEYLDMIINIPAVKALLDKVYVPKPAPATYTVSDVCLYKNPIYQTNIEKPNVVNTCAILEYGQFLATIQSRRNLIQQGGDEVLVKFTQTERGTFFEILGKEPESSSADAYEGAVAGFFISKGYQGKVAEGQKTQKPSIPRGRYDRKVRRSVIPAKPVSAAPVPSGENAEEWRITIVPKFYEGEPLDWTKDNYYTTFLFAQNADNLNIQIDPEFEARNKVVFTPGTGDNQPERLEEQMIGYFVAIPKPDPEPNP